MARCGLGGLVETDDIIIIYHLLDHRAAVRCTGLDTVLLKSKFVLLRGGPVVVKWTGRRGDYVGPSGGGWDLLSGQTATRVYYPVRVEQHGLTGTCTPVKGGTSRTGSWTPGDVPGVQVQDGIEHCIGDTVEQRVLPFKVLEVLLDLSPPRLSLVRA